MCPGAARPASHDLGGARQHHLGRREHQGRVEVALHGPAARPAYAVGQRHPPVDADHVGAGLPHQAEQLAGADAEVDPRDAELAGGGEHLGGVRHHVAAVVVRATVAPAHESNSWTAEAPASTCTAR